MKAVNKTRTGNKNIISIAIMILLFGMISFVTNLAAPMGIVVKEQFLISDALGMLGNFANFIAYAIMGIPAGLLLQKIGYKKTALVAIAVGFAGVAIQFISGVCSSFLLYLSGAFVGGFSMCMLNTVVNPMLNILGGEGNRGNRLIQAGGAFSSLTGMSVPILVGFLIGEVTKDTAIADINLVLFIAMGVFLLTGIVLFFIRIPEPHIEDSSAKREPIYTLMKFPHFVMGVVAIFLYVGIEISIPATMNFFLVDSGIPAFIAGMVVGTFYMLMLIGRFAGIFLSTYMSSRNMLGTVSAIGALLALLAILIPLGHNIDMPVLFYSSTGMNFGMYEVPVNTLFLVLMGVCTSVMWGNIFNLAVRGLDRYVEKASGIFMMMVCGGGILPLIQTALANEVGYLSSYWLIFFYLIFLLYYALVGSK